MAKKKRTNKLKGGQASKAWRLIQQEVSYKEIGDSLGFTSTAIKTYACKKFKQEATKLWGQEIMAVGKCEICPSTTDLNPHHILSKSVWPHLRFDLSNGICLCANHHMMDRDCCPHGSMPAVEAFIEWLAINREGQYIWYNEHKYDQKYQLVNYEQAYWELKECKTGKNA